MAAKREWIALESSASGGVLFCQVSSIAWFTEHYHKESTNQSAYTDEGTLRVQRASVRIDGQTIEVLESSPEIALLIRGLSTDDKRLWCLGRIAAEGGPESRDYFKLCNPLTPDAQIEEILTEVDHRAATWCAEHGDVPVDPRKGRPDA